MDRDLEHYVCCFVRSGGVRFFIVRLSSRVSRCCPLSSTPLRRDDQLIAPPPRDPARSAFTRTPYRTLRPIARTAPSIPTRKGHDDDDDDATSPNSERFRSAHARAPLSLPLSPIAPMRATVGAATSSISSSRSALPRASATATAMPPAWPLPLAAARRGCCCPRRAAAAAADSAPSRSALRSATRRHAASRSACVSWSQLAMRRTLPSAPTTAGPSSTSLTLSPVCVGVCVRAGVWVLFGGNESRFGSP